MGIQGEKYLKMGVQTRLLRERLRSEGMPEKEVLTHGTRYGSSLDIPEGIMSLINNSTTKLLGELQDIVMVCVEPSTNQNGDLRSKTLDDFTDNLVGLMKENVDILDSVERGYRDLVKGDPLKTEMKDKIRNEVMNPLRDYLNRENVKLSMPIEKVNNWIDSLEEKYISASKAR